MEKKGRKCCKALYFDLSIKALKRYFSGTNPKNAYIKIQNYFISCDFSHEQYSGYHSQYKATDLEIFQLTQRMRKTFPWLEKCINRFEVTDVGENFNLMKLFEDENADIELRV